MKASCLSFRLLLMSLLCAVSPWAVRAQDASAMPENLGRGLRELAAWHFAQDKTITGAARTAKMAAELPAVVKRAQVDAAASSAVVTVLLDGSQPAATVARNLTALGLTVLSTHETANGGAGGTITARLPLDRTLDAARAPGVFSVSLVHRPVRRVGRSPAQGAGVLHSDAVNARGITGQGISVGVLSDSFDVTTPNAAADVASGDLPGRGNPDGFTTPVFVLNEGDASNGDGDEGRAMLQIVHDIAPGATLSFASVTTSQQGFADSIRQLRQNPSSHCDVLVDDIAYPDEPFFFDGPIAQAIDDVVHRTDLSGRRVLYYSAAGNDGGLGYADDFRKVDNATVRRGGVASSSLKFNNVPEALTAGGFHNFDRSGAAATVAIAQKVTVRGAAASICLQWNDPFVPGRITTDYNVLVFDAQGNYLPNIDGGHDNNFSTGEALEIFDLPLNRDGSDTIYQLAITQSARSAGAATHFRYVGSTDASFSFAFADFTSPSIYGHSAAPGADAVAAFAYNMLDEPEDFSSTGPVTIYLDRDGNALDTPEVRQQPTLSAPDNVDTTFFPAGDGNDTDNDGFPNFGGTSAAAPHAAACAALLLQAAGGPGTLTDTQARDLFQSTAAAHDLDPFQSKAVVTDADGAGTVTITATGDSSDNGAFNKKFFTLDFSGPSTRRLKKLTINLAPAGLVFDPDADTGFPLKIRARGVTKATITSKFVSDNQGLTLIFPPDDFAPGDRLIFGVDRDELADHAGGNSADLLGTGGASVTFTTRDGSKTNKGKGAFQNEIGAGYTPAVGFGLINVEAAVNKLQGN